MPPREQEAGRAGRDNQRSECIMFYRHSDVQALQRLMCKPPARTLSKGDADRSGRWLRYYYYYYC
jgi:superfamily II DNA helicase RecQ